MKITVAATNKGFVKSVEFDRETMTQNITYTNKLREARRFSTKKSAYNFLDKYKLEGFAYCPNTEEIFNQGMYEVVRAELPWYDKELKHLKMSTREAIYFIARKVWNEKYSDIDFLNDKQHPTVKHMSEEEAKAEARRLNQLQIDLLTSKL